MCYLLREPDVSPEPGRSAVPPLAGPLRPRWVAAAGMALAATIAVAAMVAAPPAQAPEPVRQATGLVATGMDSSPATASVERTALPADDDVPTSAGTRQAAMGHCHEVLERDRAARPGLNEARCPIP